MTPPLHNHYTFFACISSVPREPVNLTAESKTFSSIHVFWKPVPEKLWFGKIIKYQVMVRQPPYNVSLVNYTTNELEANISNLEMFVKYGVAVRAFTRIGPGDESEPIYLTTRETGTIFISKM